jgi:hypothetical protein
VRRFGPDAIDVVEDDDDLFDDLAGCKVPEQAEFRGEAKNRISRDSPIVRKSRWCPDFRSGI